MTAHGYQAAILYADAQPAAVHSAEEMLTSDVREAIHSAFCVAPINMFASTEGPVGHSEPGGDVFTFATDTCIAECVDDAGQPVPDGTISSRVLVTKLHNHTQPLIRYELTDSFTPAGLSTAGFLRATVDGRAGDVFRYGGLTNPEVSIRRVGSISRDPLTGKAKRFLPDSGDP